MKSLLTLSLVLLLGIGCATPTSPITTQEELTSETLEPDSTKGLYVSFIINVHDWVFPQESLETINRLIDLHEHYHLPVELYLDDQIVQKYRELDPTIFERLKNSDDVSVSYHIRPPHPVYEGFDTIDLASLSEQQQYEILLAYETHALDLATGGYTNEPGGYAYLKELIGYAPRVVAHTTSRAYGAALSRVYEELGAVFAVVHGRETTLDDRIHGLHARPEQVEVKLYEDTYDRGFNAEKRFDEWTADWDGTSDYFINLKWHENNFYTVGTTFGYVYWEEIGRGGKQGPKTPPFDLTAGDETEFKTAQAQQEEWDIYEDMLKFLSQKTDELTVVTSKELEELLDS